MQLVVSWSAADPDAPAPTCDPYWSYTALLLHMDGADGSTTLTDSSPNTRSVMLRGNAQADTAQSKFGGSSLLLDGTGDFVSAAYDSGDTSLDFGTGDFTIELWARWNTVTNGGLFHMLLADMTEVGTVAYLAVGYTGTDWAMYANGTTYLRPMTVSTGQWYHVALVRRAGSMTLYIDGVAQGAAIANVGSYSNLQMHIGVYYSTAYTFNGWLDEFRVTNGIARYTADFTPPTEAFASTACA